MARPRRIARFRLGAATVVVLIVAAAVGGAVLYLNFAPGAPARGVGPLNATVVPYASSVDGFALSYDEWLPPAFNGSEPHPLVVYLHGQQDTNGTLYPGGLTNDLAQDLTGAVIPDRNTAWALVNATRSAGVILIAPNSRTGAGWYIDSPCGGPQQQDVLDAIASEKARHDVGAVYLLGHSMGTEGVLYTAGEHPGMFAGVGVIAPVTDLFEDVAYRETLLTNPMDAWANASIQAKERIFCGVLPGTENASASSVAQAYEAMSPLRFDPAAFAGVPIYMTAGGQDDRAPDSVAIWSSWLNANNTMVNATCNYAPGLGEPVPPDCSTSTLGALHAADPAAYTFRFVYEPAAGHGISQLDPTDLLAFWFGTVPGGYYLGAPNGGTISPSAGPAY